MIGGMGQGILGAWGSRKAGKAHGRAIEKAIAHLVQQLYPYRQLGEFGVNALREMLETGPGEFVESPGYQFRLGEGTKALERSAAARGGLLGGATGKALERYGQEYASGEYQNFLNRYYQKLEPHFRAAQFGLAGLGMVPNLLTEKGAVQGAYMQNAANALGSMFSGMGGMGGGMGGGGGGSAGMGGMMGGMAGSIPMNAFAQSYYPSMGGYWGYR